MRMLNASSSKKTQQTENNGRGQGVTVRLRAQELARLDKWAGEQSDRPSRAEALRRLASKMLDLLEPPTMSAPAAFEQTEAPERPLSPLPPLRRD